jgi:hypothetical protein
MEELTPRSCTCRAEFCYECGQKWKVCICERWLEERLEARAEQVVARENPEIQGVYERAQAVAAMRQELVEQHECRHHGRWRKQDGRYRCEMCHERFYKFILVCRHCHIMACQDCRSHRI